VAEARQAVVLRLLLPRGAVPLQPALEAEVLRLALRKARARLADVVALLAVAAPALSKYARL
jgi:hypothetical protein